MALAIADARDTSFAFAISWEGGYSNDPADDGNWSGGAVGVGTLIGSQHGVTAPEYQSFVPRGVTVTAQMMKDLTLATAEAIWSTRYWQAMRCGDMPGPVGLGGVDFEYNAGRGEAAPMLQRLVGLTGDDVDGWIGDQSIAAIKAWKGPLPKLSVSAAKPLQAALGMKADGIFGPLSMMALKGSGRWDWALAAALMDQQATFYRSCRQFPEYGNGWLNRTWARLAKAVTL
jgi:lysozyme family protein